MRFVPFFGETVNLYENVRAHVISDGTQIVEHLPLVLVELIEEYSLQVLREPVFELLIPRCLARYYVNRQATLVRDRDCTSEPLLFALVGKPKAQILRDFYTITTKEAVVFQTEGSDDAFSLVPHYDAHSISVLKVQDPRPKMRDENANWDEDQVEFQHPLVTKEERTLWIRIEHEQPLVRLKIFSAREQANN